MKVEVKLVSKLSNRIIVSYFTPVQLLENMADDLIDMVNDNECFCNTESGFSYCGCRDEFEECLLFVDGELVIQY